MKRPVELGIIV